jgi:PAS domain S-box-containing protein
MRLREIIQFVEGASDPAFAVDGLGNIATWNRGASEIFGISPAEVIGKACREVVRGTDGCGMVCSRDCVVRQAANRHQLIHNFDLQIETPQGRKWFSLSLVIVDVAASRYPYIIHILRFIDVSKRLEMTIRDFIQSKTNISQEQFIALMSSTRSAVSQTYLTKRELEILSLVANGKTSMVIAEQLYISRATVDNHLQHILKKLKAHSRLEAVRRAERSGIL